VHLGGSADSSEDAGLGRLRAEPAAANDQPEQLAAEFASPALANAVGERRRDPLIDINGIGPVYARRLFDAGIYTFEELAAQSPARLRELVGAKAWQDADTAAWIAEARIFAQAAQGRAAQ
jgi:predicted flap endonuclease-1-like 5' DNA nuclease